MTEQALFEADLAALASFAEAEELLAQLASALFPDGMPSLDRLTWRDPGDLDDVLDPAQRLAAAQARFRTLVEQIPAVTFMAVLGEGKNDVYVSPHIEQLLGYTQGEWLEDPFLWYWRLHPDDRALWNDEFARGCRTGGPFRAACRFLARDGRIVWVHGEARVVRDELGRPMFLQGVAFDITDAKCAQERFVARAVQEARHQAELAVAARVQAQVLPRDLAAPGYEVAAAMVPALEIGGDYYDVLPAPATTWLAIGDASGQGLDAGLVMMMVQSAIAALVRVQPNAAPHDLVTSLNGVLYDNVRTRLESTEHVTCTLVRLDPTGRVVFAGAHEDILLWRARSRTMERIPTPGVWLGTQRDITNITTDTTLHLDGGDLMILYTDGITDARAPWGKRLELDGLRAIVERVVDRSPEDIRDHVIASTRAWMAQQHDDMSVVVIRRAQR